MTISGTPSEDYKNKASAAPSLALRVRAVADAHRRDDLRVLAGELDLLAEAATQWAILVRAHDAAPAYAPRNPCAF
jgi:hypothetical protein